MARLLRQSAHASTDAGLALRAMREDDRRALYRFVKSLGPAGVPAPAYTPPGQPPAPPYLDLVLPPVVAAGPTKVG